MNDTPTLVRFVSGWAEDGLSKDGLPHYRETLKIIKERPPYLLIEREATDDDIAENRDPYALYEKEQRAKKKTPASGGFPLVLWPVCNAAEIQMLAARDIYTVEQLAKMAGRGHEGMPGELRELAERAKKMVQLSSEIGKFEAIILEKDGQIEALTDQVRELRDTIKAQDGLINGLKQRVA